MRMTRRQAGFDRCRALGHAWYEVPADRTPPFGVYFWTKCESCDTIRKDIRTRYGDMLARSYDYPDDYKDTEQHTRADWYARLMAPRIGEETPVERKLGRDIEALKERLREARLAERAAMPSTPTSIQAGARQSARTTVRKSRRQTAA